MRETVSSRVPFSIADVQLWALSDLDRLIHASVHMLVSRGEYRRLSSVADVLVLGRKLEERALETLDRAEMWGIRPVVEAAVVNAALRSIEMNGCLVKLADVIGEAERQAGAKAL